MDSIDIINADKLGWWLSERQLPSGGLNGRPEKLEDVCYSWWVLSSLDIINRLEWINKNSLVDFILRSQDAETGGIADRPGDLPDVFHTLFGICGLSLCGHELDFDNGSAFPEIDPRYCLPKNVIEDHFSKLNLGSAKERI